VLSAILAVCAAFDEDLASVKFSDIGIKQTRDAPADLTTGVFETPLNHFSPTDNRRLRQTYHANVEYFEDNGPLFFFINDGSGTHWISQGLVVDLAKTLKGAVVTADTRYINENRWGPSTVENLSFLTTEHVLADFPYLVRKVKEDLDSSQSHVVVWGSKLSASIAALTRKKFPHVVNGVWSSSGIFRAVSTETEFYNTLAFNLYLRGPTNCSSRLGSALAQVQELVESGKGAQVQTLFNLCAPVNATNGQEKTFFYENLFDYVSSYIDTRHNTGIQELCSDLGRKNDTLRAFARWVQYVFGDDTCTNLNYAATINNLRNTTSVEHNSRRVLEYFYCTQFGLNFRVTTEDGFGGVFPNVISRQYHDQWCSDIFGNAYNRTLFERAVDNFNLQNGAQDQVISNAIFSNGNLDPYLSHGISEYDIYASEAVNTQFVGSSADLGSLSETDTVELAETKRAVVAALTRFADIPEEEEDEESEEDDDGDEPSPFFGNLLRI